MEWRVEWLRNGMRKEWSFPFLQLVRWGINPVIELLIPILALGTLEWCLEWNKIYIKLTKTPLVRPGIPPNIPNQIPNFLMGGFDRLLDQLAQIEINSVGQCDHPPITFPLLQSPCSPNNVSGLFVFCKSNPWFTIKFELVPWIGFSWKSPNCTIWTLELVEFMLSSRCPNCPFEFSRALKLPI